jgi:hypothetical protein
MDRATGRGAGVLGQPGEPEHPACGHAGANQDQRAGAVRGTNRDASVAAVTIPAVDGTWETRSGPRYSPAPSA